MATTEQKFLDYPGLEYYHQQNIAIMDEKDVSVLDNSKSYTDSSVQAKGNELGTRIDNLILNAGDSSAECADARVTKDGTVHDTLKNRLDTEYSQLSSDIANSGIKNKLELEWLDGYVDCGGALFTTGDTGGGKYTQPIDLKIGETIILNGVGYLDRVAMISKYNSATSRTPLVISESGVSKYEYTATEDIQVILSALNSENNTAYILANINARYEELKESIEVVNSKVETDILNKNELTLEWANGYVDPYGYLNNVGDTGRAVYTASPIELKRGETIVLNGSGYSNNVSMITRWNSETSRMPLVISESGVTRYEYTANADMKIILSALKSSSPSAYTIIYPNDMYDVLKESKNYLYSFFDIFHKIGGVGDSLMSGEHAYNDGTTSHYVDLYSYSWLSNIARKNGIECVHYSEGGLTAKAWLTSKHKTALENEEVKPSAYFIGLGTNEINQGVALGTIEDCGTDNDTFYANYYKVIQTIKNAKSNAKIFCLSLYWGKSETVLAFANAIKEIAEANECYYVDLLNLASDYTEKTEFINWGHYTTLGYSRVSKEIESIVNTIISNNISDFSMLGMDNRSI